MEGERVRKAVARAAGAIATLGPGYWARWVVYLLELLDAKCQERDVDPVEAFLGTVCDDLGIRIRDGCW